ncbi:ROK family protein [Sulfuricaulis sp.]|jgi:fructokinase|uniref:ROK family protein n=1 Tax=Sulfuricaulis sp. TaxID=2003553 RepID=UPI00355A4C04
MLRIGLDLGGTKTEGIVMNEAGKMLYCERLPTPQADGYDAILKNIHALVFDLEKKAGQSCHVGIGTPGAISTRTGCLKNSNTVCLNGKPLKDDLEKILARPVRLANDANCFALSEALDGAGQDAGVVFGVIMGTGVGGGIVINGQLIEGLQHIAGEWGHNVLETDGPPCYCGKHGCVETLLSGPGLAHDYALHGGDPSLDAKQIVTHAEQGDVRAEAAMQRYLDRFGRALSTVINILDPDVVVLGGGMSNIARLCTDGRERVARYVFNAQGSANVAGDRMSRATNDELRTRILPHVHGDSSGVRGAAQLWPAENS